MRLTSHFTLRELSTTSTGIPNTANDEQMSNMLNTAIQMEAVRALLGHNPINISSGFRNAAVNKAVGGSKTSAHLTGEAVDFTCSKFGTTTEICHILAKSSIPFDQLIWEENLRGSRWVHIGFRHKGKARRQILTKRPGKNYVKGLPPL